MKTLIFIHGWESFETQEKYLRFLEDTYVDWQSEPWTPEEKTSWSKEIAKKWHANGWIVYMPVFPNKLDAKYNEWKVVFEGILSKLNPEDTVTLVGWSLGGCFILKYFSEITEHGLLRSSQWRQKKIDQIHLVAACISEWDFRAPTNYESLQELGNRVHIWHAEDDMVVPFETAKTLSKTLSEAQTHFFGTEKWYGHFHGIEKIPELENILI